MFRRRLAQAMAGGGTTEAPQTSENAPRYPADLDTAHYAEYDRLTSEIRSFLSCARFKPLRRFVREKVVRRLLEKLQESQLNENSVPQIASGVWHKLKDACGEEMLGEKPVIQEIVRDILHEYENAMPSLARGIVATYVQRFCKVDDRVVEIAIREMWPEIKQQLGV